MIRAELGLLEVLGLVVNAGLGGMCRGELGILLSSIFGEKNPLGFARGQLVRLFLTGSCYGLLQAVKVWPLQGPIL